MIQRALLFAAALRIVACFLSDEEQAMQGWQARYLGLRSLPRAYAEFELQALFGFSRAELERIAHSRGDNHKLGLALLIAFVHMSGRLLNSVRAVPASLLRHLGRTLGQRGLEAAFTLKGWGAEPMSTWNAKRERRHWQDP